MLLFDNFSCLLTLCFVFAVIRFSLYSSCSGGGIQYSVNHFLQEALILTSNTLEPSACTSQTANLSLSHSHQPMQH